MNCGVDVDLLANSLPGGGPSPGLDIYGSLSNIHTRSLPPSISHFTIDGAQLRHDLHGSLTINHRFISGVLDTPTGYTSAVSGSIVYFLYEPHDTNAPPQGYVYFGPTMQWRSEADARAFVDETADELWSAHLHGISLIANVSGQSASAAVADDALAQWDDYLHTPTHQARLACFEQYHDDLDACENTFESDIQPYQLALENAIISARNDLERNSVISFWDVIEGAAVGGGAGSIVGGGIGFACGGIGAAPGAVIGGVFGFAVGSVAGPAEKLNDATLQYLSDIQDAQQQFENSIAPYESARARCRGEAVTRYLDCTRDAALLTPDPDSDPDNPSPPAQIDG